MSWRRFVHRLLGRPGIQRHTVPPLSEYAAEERRILDEFYCQDRTGDDLPRRVPTGEHDRYPGMTDEVRATCIGYLETMYALPDAEVQR